MNTYISISRLLLILSVLFITSCITSKPVHPPSPGEGMDEQRLSLDRFHNITRIGDAMLPVRDHELDWNDYNLKYKTGPAMPRVKYITIHNTWNFGSAADEREYLNNRRDNAYVSYHFAVDETEAVRIMPLDIVGWHAGDSGRGPGNTTSVGIEICRSRCVGDDEKLYLESEKNAIVLAAYLLHYFNLDINALKKHQDWSGKYCPHRILDEKRWDSFKAEVANELAKYITK